MMMLNFAAVALGGALGASLRHGVNVLMMKAHGGFPYWTFAVNVSGSFAMGLLIAALAHGLEMPQHWKLFCMTGVLGGYTTFSAFSMDAVALMERGDFIGAALYILGSVALSLLGLFLGVILMRAVMA
jgi:CrcB protein